MARIGSNKNSDVFLFFKDNQILSKGKGHKSSSRSGKVLISDELDPRGVTNGVCNVIDDSDGDVETKEESYGRMFDYSLIRGSRIPN